MKWSESAWAEARHIYHAILELPFVKELADGSLSEDRFLFYIRQDSLYIENYTRVLAHIASRLPRREHIEAFLNFASEGIVVEKALHQSYLGEGHAPATSSPTTLLYTSFESSLALGPVEVEAAAILPCFWVYQRVGEVILRCCSRPNPYSGWIDTYADPSFGAATQRAIEICDQLAAEAAPYIRARMTDAFLTATKMEWMFWHSAYNLENWKI
ncbi:MAG: TenA family protein [Muribaculaceae bacterium]|nr:TenA family protein [Muribaculaceae bacterium]